MKNPENPTDSVKIGTTTRTISSQDVANYVVCPEAWRLKYSAVGTKKSDVRAVEGRKRRRKWVEDQDLSGRLMHYAKMAYLLVLCVVIIVFLWEQKRTFHGNRFWQKFVGSESKSGP